MTKKDELEKEKDEQNPQDMTTPTGEDKKDQAADEKFSQEDVNKIVADRLKREKQKFADYEDLKAKAAKLKEIEEANKSEAEKLAEANEKLQKESKAKDAKIKASLRKSAIIAEATALGFADPEYALYKVTGNEDIIVSDDFEVVGTKAVLEALAKDAPDLLAKQKTTKPDATNPAHGKKGETLDQKRARIYGHGVDVYDPDQATKHGGGVIFTDPSAAK